MVRQKWTDEKVSEIREAKANGLTLKELGTRFSLSKGQVNFAVYKYQMKQPKEKNKKEGKGKTFLEWLFG